MKKFKISLLTVIWFMGMAAAFARPGPNEPCAVSTRMELDLMCPNGAPICCRFLQHTILIDTNEEFYQGQYYPGYYTPIH